MYYIFIRILVAIVVLFFEITPPGYSFQDIEKPSKLVLQKQLEQEFVSPCCYREAVELHRSGKAEEVRSKISTMLDEGKTFEEITATLVAEYGERILIKPTTEGFNIFAWIGPFIMIAIGFVIVGFWLYRFRPRGDNSELTIPDEDF